MVTPLKRLWFFLQHLLRWPVLFLIRIYQKTLSPDHGVFKIYFPYGYCKFTPTCSQYTYEAVERYGIFRGLGKGIYRVLRCNPCNQGGVDRP